MIILFMLVKTFAYTVQLLLVSDLREVDFGDVSWRNCQEGAA